MNSDIIFRQFVQGVKHRAHQLELPSVIEPFNKPCRKGGGQF
jgi:hypothetical protein